MRRYINEDQFGAYQVQSQLQNEAGDIQAALSAPNIQEQVAQAQAVLVEATNPERILEEIELKLRGKIKMPDGRTLEVSEPLMNNMGIAKMLFALSPLLNQNTILSHLEDKEISKLIIDKGETIQLDLAINWREYGVSDRATLNHIEDSILFPAYLALKRALGQNEKNWLGKVTLESISGRSGLSQPKKEGFLSKLKL